METSKGYVLHLDPPCTSLIRRQCNVLIDDDGNACLTDFGLSRILGTTGFTTKTGSGTQRFMAPELIPLGEHLELIPLEEHGALPIPRVTTASDVWAFSLLVIEVRDICRYSLSLTNCLTWSIFSGSDWAPTLPPSQSRCQHWSLGRERWSSESLALSGD
jgi:serine/threonine protein kinase